MIVRKSRKRKSNPNFNDNFHKLTNEEKETDWKQIYDLAFSWGEKGYYCVEPSNWRSAFFASNSNRKRSKQSIVNWLVNESKIRTGYEKPIYFISDENELWNVAYQMLKSTSFERLIQQINNSKRSCLDTWHDQGDDGPLYRGIFIQKIREADLNILINALDENSFLSIANLKFPVLMTVHYDNLFCLRWITGTMKYDDSKYIFDFKWCSEEPSFICEEKNVETELPEWCNAMMIEWLPSPNLFHEKYQNFMYTNCLCQLTGIDGVKLECDWPGIKNLELDVNTKWVDQNIGHPLLKEDYAFLSFPLPNTLTSRQIFIRLDPLYFHFILQSILLVPLINIISEYLFELPNPTCH